MTLAAEFRESAQQSGDRLLSLQTELCEEALLDRYAERVDADEAPGNYAWCSALRQPWPMWLSVTPACCAVTGSSPDCWGQPSASSRSATQMPSEYWMTYSR